MYRRQLTNIIINERGEFNYEVLAEIWFTSKTYVRFYDRVCEKLLSHDYHRLMLVQKRNSGLNLANISDTEFMKNVNSDGYVQIKERTEILSKSYPHGCKMVVLNEDYYDLAADILHWVSESQNYMSDNPRCSDTVAFEQTSWVVM